MTATLSSLSYTNDVNETLYPFAIFQSTEIVGFTSPFSICASILLDTPVEEAAASEVNFFVPAEFGSIFKWLFSTRAKFINIIMALLLVYCAISLLVARMLLDKKKRICYTALCETLRLKEVTGDFCCREAAGGESGCKGPGKYLHERNSERNFSQ